MRWKLLTVLIGLGLSVGFFGRPVTADSHATIYYYYGQGCPHCANVETYFQEIGAYDTYPLEQREVYFNRTNAAAYNADLEARGYPAGQRGVPALVIGDQVIIGDAPIIEQFVPLAQAFVATHPSAPVSDRPEATSSDTLATEGSNDLSLWLVIGASLVDAINPCAFAVLIVLLTTVLAQKGQTRRVLASGLAFSAAIFVSYLLMGLGVYQALASAHSTGLFTAVVGVLAILLGLFNLKDWLWYGRTPPMEVPMSWRPKMASFIERVTSPVGALAAGLVVSLFLLPCTSGPYIVVLGLLADNPLDVGAVFYLVLYNLIFILPMLLITVLVARGLDVDRLSYLREKHIQKLHLVAGLILIGLGTYVLLT